jgi:glycerate 2-kinase
MRPGSGNGIVHMDELRRLSSIIVDAVLRAADPRVAVGRSLRLEDDRLVVENEVFPLPGALAFVSAGKASAPMTEAFLEAAGSRISRGIVVMPKGYTRVPAPRSAIDVICASHPVPDANGLAAARRVLEMVSSLAAHDLCIILLSGGASSLLSFPLPPVSLEDLRTTTSLLLKSGADIKQINTVRKHLSRIAGGRLAEAARCRTLTLAISDVVGDPPAFIGSGPTVADPSTFDDALAVLGAYDLERKVPASVAAVLRNGSAGKEAETPKRLSDRHVTRVIASNMLAVEAAAQEAASRGFAPHLLSAALTGEARDAGRDLARAARKCKERGVPVPPPACLIAGGETTVTVVGSGRGGRNQELALSAAIELDGADGILVCSVATDGIDGNSEAAGARVDGGTVQVGRLQGLDPERHLLANDSRDRPGGPLAGPGPRASPSRERIEWVPFRHR